MTEEQQQLRLRTKPFGKIWYLSRNTHDEKGKSKKKQCEKLSFFKEGLSAKTKDKKELCERRGCSGWDLVGVFGLERITGARYFGPHKERGCYSNSNENYDSVV